MKETKESVKLTHAAYDDNHNNHNHKRHPWIERRAGKRATSKQVD